jgi:hypothetical protein
LSGRFNRQGVKIRLPNGPPQGVKIRLCTFATAQAHKPSPPCRPFGKPSPPSHFLPYKLSTNQALAHFREPSPWLRNCGTGAPASPLVGPLAAYLSFVVKKKRSYNRHYAKKGDRGPTAAGLACSGKRGLGSSRSWAPFVVSFHPGLLHSQ